MNDHTAEKDVLDRHNFGEAVGGYTDCMCGWPTREQWEAGENPVSHVIAELCEAGVLTRVIPPGSPAAPTGNPT